MDVILQYLRRHGQLLDTEIAAGMGISLQKVRAAVTKLAESGDVLVCRSIHFKDGKPVEAMLCRISGYIPPAAPGRKPQR